MPQDDAMAGRGARDGDPRAGDAADDGPTVLFSYDGPAYLRPVGRGLSLSEGPELDDLDLGLLSGDYDVTIVIRGRPSQRRGPLQPGPGLPPGLGRVRPAKGGSAGV